MEKRLKVIVKEVCMERNTHLIEVECDKDHIHMLVDVDPQFGIHKLIKQIKGRSSKILREEFPFLKKILPSLWTNSYFVSTARRGTIKYCKAIYRESKNSNLVRV